MVPKKSQLFTIITFNTYGVPLLSPFPFERYKILANKLEHLAIDVINLQEVHTHSLLRLLKERLPSYPFVTFKPSLFGPKGALVIFSRHPFEEVYYNSFATTKKRLSERIFQSINLRNKGALVIKLHDMPLVIINTHLTANTDNDWSQKNRYYSIHQEEITQLVILLREIKERKNTAILSGDFNIAKGSKLYQQFIRLSNAKDAFQKNAEPTYHKEYLPSGRNSHTIDYIFYTTSSENIDLFHTSFLFQQKVQLPNKKDLYLSDHIGLMAQFSFVSSTNKK